MIGMLGIGLQILLSASPLRAEPSQDKNQILIIHSYHSGLAWTDSIASGIRDAFTLSGSDIQMTSEYLDARRYPDSEISAGIQKLLISKLKDAAPDLIMVSDNNAFDFILEHRNRLFPGIPIVFCGINDFNPSKISKHPGITGVAEELSIRETVLLILDLHPGTREIVVIGRVSVAADRYNRDSFIEALPQLPSRLKVSFWDDLPSGELKSKLKNLKKDTVLFINGLVTNPEGRQMLFRETTTWLAQNSKVPAYSLWDVFMGCGVVGGKMVTGYHQGQMAGHIALRILQGESAGSIPVVSGLEANHFIFDYRQLQRFRIPLSKLPPKAIFINRPDSFYEKHKTIVWGTLSVISCLGFLVVLLSIAVVRIRRAERALKTNEERTRLFFERQIVGMAITSPEKKWLKVNDRLCSMLGYSRMELDLLNWTDLTCPDDLDSGLTHFDRLLSGEINEYTLEKRFIRKDGSVLFTNLSVGCVRNEKGDVDYVLAILEDITKRKNAEESLRESEEFLFSIIENFPNMIFIKDARDLKFVGVNRAGEKLLGYKREDLIGKNDYDFFPEERADYFTKMDREVLENRKLLDIPEEILDTCSGRRIIHTKKMPIMDKDGKPAYLLGISEDITRIKEDAVEREKLREQLVQAQKLESVGRLAGGVAHDFNNMLTAILGQAELSMMLCSPSDPLHAGFKAIEDAAHRSADLVRQLLAFARKQTVAPKILNVNDTAAVMLKMLERLLGENINLTWIPKTGLWSVKIDPSQVDQLLANLCVNARDAISGTGKVTIETDNAVFDKIYSDIHQSFVSGEFVMLAVSDSGKGMEKRILDHIFEPFFTTKERGKGTGLGLATVYGIVKQNNGFINVYSEPGKGSTFKIYLPRCEGEKAALPSPDVSPLPKSGGETILLTEDESVILNVGRAMLESLGYKVLTAVTPAEALRQAKSFQAEIHLLLTDVVMPEMNGKELVQLIREIRPGLKCLFTSGYTADVIAHNGVLDEGVVFIQKPFSMQNMAVKVREALEQE